MSGEIMSGELNTMHVRTNFGSKVASKLTLAAVLATGLSASVAAPSLWAQASQAAGRSDSQIQSDVGYALSNSPSLKNQHITAATVEGDVTVSGNVRDEASKELAESLIYRVNGVRSVTNNLTVGDAAPASAQAADNNAPLPDPDANQQQDPNAQQQDPNYDPAQQNMAQVNPNDPPPPPPASDPQYNGQQQPQEQQQYPQQQEQQPRQQYPNNSGYYNQPQQPQPPAGPVTVPGGTLLQVRTSEPLDATKVQVGQVFQATVASDVYQGNVLAIPRGAVISGKVVATKSNSGDLAGKQGLQLALTSINLGGQSYTLPADTWSGQGPGKAGYTAGNTVGGAAIGAVIGAIAGRGMGAAIGAGVGGAVGAGASAATTGPRMYVPAEAVLNFHLTGPITVTPVSPQEAQRLASASGQPQLRQRYPYPYPAAYGYPPPPPPPGYYYRYPAGYYPYYYYRY
jgi:hypothetical protein